MQSTGCTVDTLAKGSVVDKEAMARFASMEAEFVGARETDKH